MEEVIPLIAICLRGPAGVGKTTIAYELARELRRRGFLKEKLGYVSADMFAYISMDCRYTEIEMNLKYRHIELILRSLAACAMDVIYDDTYHRVSDYQFIEALLQELKYSPIYKFSLSSPLGEVLKRNRARFWKERLADKRIIQVHRFHSALVCSSEIGVDTCLEIETNIRWMADKIVESI